MNVGVEFVDVRHMRRAAPAARHGRAGQAGCLYVVGTPIGNKEDITLRALKVLRSADVIAAEDTRKTKALLHMHGIKIPKMVSVSEHAPRSRISALVESVRDGQSIALTTDAGTPGVSDPGAELVSACRAAQLPVVPIPGVSAVTAAVSVSGFAGSFLFAGFLPRKRSALAAVFREHLASPHSLVFFESPLRVASCLKVAAEVLGKERTVVVAREISKVFEEVRSEPLGTLAVELEARAKKEGRVKGEFTVVVGPSVDRKEKRRRERSGRRAEEEGGEE